MHSLVNKLPEGAEIVVMTTLPNRYSQFSADALEFEKNGPVTIHRFAILGHASGMLDQTRAFFSYVFQVFKKIQNEKYDLVFATSSRLMTACLGSFISRWKMTPLYLDIRDIFADTIKEVFPASISFITFKIFSFIEKLAFNRAAKINLVSQGFEKYFRSRYPHKEFSFFTNGIDDEFMEMKFPETMIKDKKKKKTVIYAGNIGEGQGLHLIIPELGQLLKDDVNFRIIGAGGKLELLQQKLKINNSDNVQLVGPMKRDELMGEYLKADVLFLHLNDYEAFKKVLPSKIFEYAFMRKPIWGGLSGYAALFAEEIENAAIFHPCDAKGGAEAFRKLRFEETPRKDFIKKYARKNIMSLMADDILSFLKKDRA